MAKSIMQDEKECYLTKSTSNLHKHHIYPGAYRNKSEKYGLWIWLRADYHVGTNHAVHNNPNMMKRLMQLGQEKFEELHSREEFMNIFGKNYL